MSDIAPHRRASRSFPIAVAGFTLVELLVVIGIIGALIAILLPVLSGVQARGRDIKCQSNLRQICQAMIGYATENKGSMPYGFYYLRSDPSTWDDVGSGDEQGRFISWASQVGKYMGKRLDGDNENNNFPPVLQCAEAQQVAAHPLSYSMNMIVGIYPLAELALSDFPPNGNAQKSPPKLNLMMKGGTAVVWDTAVGSDWENNLGWLVGFDIDTQRFWQGAAVPQQRYYKDYDPIGQLDPQLSNSKPIRLNVGSTIYKNRDVPDAGPFFTYQGTLRFRHNKGTACNVGYSDGSVSQFIAKVRGDGTVQSHDAIRSKFMIKYPTGVTPDPSYPS